MDGKCDCNEHTDKSMWGPGPWQDEPNRVDFEAHGFPCLLHRSPTSGGWCGYVAVPPGHCAYKKGYDDVDVDVHGGLTYADTCNEHICHVPKPGEPDDVWWLGFDCGHAWDLMPAFHVRFPAFHQLGVVYRTIDYARQATERLAAQLAVLEQ